MPRCIFKVLKKQKPFTELHAKSLEPDLGSKTTAGFKTWFLCNNSFGILVLNYYCKELHVRCCDGPNDSLEISCWEYCVLINNHNQELIRPYGKQKKLIVIIYESIFYLKKTMSVFMVFLVIVSHDNY